MSEAAPIEVGVGHYFEALDRSYMLQAQLEVAFEGHPVMSVDAELAEHYREAQRQLAALYQKLSDKLAEG